MREKRALLIAAALTLLWMGVIFRFSAQPSDVSAALSGSLLEALLSAVVPRWNSRSPAEQQSLLDCLHTLFRKCGHFSEYTILGILLTATVRRIPGLISDSRQAFPKRKIILPALCALLYAVSDEIHQSFVPGRSCELRDVCIDFAGACTGILLASVFLRLRRRIRRKKQP